MSKLSALVLPLVLLSGLEIGAPITADALSGPLESVSSFSVTAPTTVPGETLKAGTYTIGIVDHLPDRSIIRIYGQSGKILTTFLGVEATDTPPSRNIGPLLWDIGPDHNGALRGFTFPNRKTLEFVYPKGMAVSLAKANSSSVTAVDPESDNIHAAYNLLSPEEEQVVTLWVLSPKKVDRDGNAEPAIAAQRYYPSHVNQRAQSVDLSASSAGNSTVPSANPQMAMANHKPVLSALPHTASQLPLILLMGLLSLLAALGIRFARAFDVTA